MYNSTRCETITATAKHAILKGLADDGGLFVLPNLAEIKIDLEDFVNLDYNEIAKLV